MRHTKIHFSEHISESYKQDCLRELEEVGANIAQQDSLTYDAGVEKTTKLSFIIEFLRNEERTGSLSFVEPFI